MATHLYPNTSCPKILEVLAGVPEGTHALILKILSKHNVEMQDLNNLYLAALSCGAATKKIEDQIFIAEENYHNTLTASSETKRLDKFLVFGWGTLSTKACSALSAFGTPNFGELSCPIQTELVLSAQGIKLPANITVNQIEGLTWN